MDTLLHPISRYENFNLLPHTFISYQFGGYELINVALGILYFWVSIRRSLSDLLVSQAAVINLVHTCALSFSSFLHQIKPPISVLDRQFDFPLFSRQRRNLRGIQPRLYICCFFRLITSCWGFLFCLRVAASSLLSLPQASTLSISVMITNPGQPIIEAVESFVSAYTISWSELMLFFVRVCVCVHEESSPIALRLRTDWIANITSFPQMF